MTGLPGVGVPTVGGPGRRTQEQRRAATRAALLDATIEVLVERGHANLTTHEVARRARVTRGAMPHYFTSKADLLVQALERLADQLATQAEATVAPARAGHPEDYPALLDRLWQVHRGPLFAAALELWVAARGDAELRDHLRRFEREVAARIGGAAARFLPGVAGAPGFDGYLASALAAMRGVALLGPTAGAAGTEKLWRAVRRELLLAAAARFGDGGGVVQGP